MVKMVLATGPDINKRYYRDEINSRRKKMEKKTTEKDLVFYNPPNFSFSPKKLLKNST